MAMDLNMANRQCCDLDIRDYKTNAPWMFADFCNTTTAGFSGDSVFAKKKGVKAIAFHNPIEGTMSCEFQCHPFRVYALLSDGSVKNDAILATRKEITCATQGTLLIDGTPVDGTVFVYKQGEFGSGIPVVGTFTNGTFTATETSDLIVDTIYEVGYLEKKSSGVQRVSFNFNKIPKDYRVEMQTLDKDANGDLIPVKIIAYKATPKRQLELSFSSEGEPASIKIDFDVLADRNDDVLDIVEITE